MPTRDDELKLWNAFGKGAEYRTPRAAGEALGMSEKRVGYLCEKWARKYIYDYGVALDLGWKVES